MPCILRIKGPITQTIKTFTAAMIFEADASTASAGGRMDEFVEAPVQE